MKMFSFLFFRHYILNNISQHVLYVNQNQCPYLLKGHRYIITVFLMFDIAIWCSQGTALTAKILSKHLRNQILEIANEAVVILLPSNITVFTLDFSGSGLSDGEHVSLGWHEVSYLFLHVFISLISFQNYILYASNESFFMN